MARIKVFDTTTQSWVYADKSFGKDGESITITNITESSDDGGSNVVEFSDGTTVAIKNGKTGGTGEPGKTPTRGVDYWTEADQEAMVQQVITALGTPVFGRVEEGNKIITTGNLAAGTYEYWFEDENGKQVFVGTLDHNGEEEPTYTNWIKKSTEADGVTPYNGGKGWKANTRLSSSGAESTASATGMECTGFIPFKRGDVIRFSGITMNRNSTNAVRCYFIQYKDNDSGEKEMLKQWNVAAFNYAIAQGWVLADADDNITQINTADFADESNTEAVVPIYTTAQYFRISADEINDDSIITLNQEITEPEPAYTNLANPDDSNWIEGMRYNSSKVLTEWEDAATGRQGAITNYIDVSSCQEYIHVKGLDMTQGNSRYYKYDTIGGEIIEATNASSSGYVETASYDSSVQLIPANRILNAKIWRLGGLLTGTSEDVIITIDEDIK